MTIALLACAWQPTPNEPAPAASGQAKGQPRATSDAAPLPSAADIDTGAVRRLFAQWLKAHDAGRFDEYSALYATRFTGVKRAGTRMTTFDRARWLADRQRMFERPMKVEASNVTVNTSPQAATITFVQRWSSATFSDEGPKQIVVVREGDQLRIAREEMLASTVGALPLAPADGRAGFVYALNLGPSDETFVVLDARSKPDWSSGPVRLVSRRTPAAACAKASAAAPAELRGWAGRPVRVYGSLSRCDARVADLFVLSVVSPHFGTLQEWDGQSENGPRWTDQKVADQIFRQSRSPDGGEGTFLVGKLDRACSRAVWAQPADQPEPAVLFAAKNPDTALLSRAGESFRGLALYQQLQREWRGQGGTGASSEWAWSEGAPRTTAWIDPTGAPRVVTIGAAVGGCGDGFAGHLGSAFALSGSKLVELGGSTSADTFNPLSVVDLDGDGAYELIGEDSFGPPRSTRASRPIPAPPNVVWPNLDCPC